MFFLPIGEIGENMEEKKSRYTEAQAKAAKKYLTETVEDVRIRVPKGQKAIIKAHAESQGESMNQFVTRAIDKTMYQKILYLDTSIMLNSELQEELETLLIENSDFIESYSRESISTGENRLILQFIKNDPINHNITEQYCKVLDKYSVRYSEHNNVPFDSMERDNQDK